MEFTLAFPIEEDMVNLGSWLLLYHPKFFTENFWGHMRFFFWFVFSCLILSIQLLLVTKFSTISLQNYNQEQEIYEKLIELGESKYLNNYFETVKENAAKNKTTEKLVKQDNLMDVLQTMK